MDIDNILSKNISSGEKNYKYYWLYTSRYVKDYDGETKWIYFSIEDDENIILLGLKSAIVLKNYLITNSYTIKMF